MKRLEVPQSTSWLSLVAETAGVSGATVARVVLFMGAQAGSPASRPRRAWIQIQDPAGRVVGATQVWGDEADFQSGLSTDVGCDLDGSAGCEVVAWLDEESHSLLAEPRHQVAPPHAARCGFDVTHAMKLILTRARPLTEAA